MSLTPAEKQQVEAALDAFIASPNVQATITNFVASGEAQGVKVLDAIISNAKAGGLLGGLMTALKGSAEAEVNTLAASFPPAVLTALLSNAIVGEIKAVLG